MKNHHFKIFSVLFMYALMSMHGRVLAEQPDRSCLPCDNVCADVVNAKAVFTKKLGVKHNANIGCDLNVKGNSKLCGCVVANKDLAVCGSLTVKGTINACDAKTVCIIPWPNFPNPAVPATVDLSGKVALVTGASRGIGRAIAEKLKSEGVTVIGTSRQAAGFPGPGQFLKPYFIPQSQPNVDFLVELDLVDPVSVGSFLNEVTNLFGAGGPLEGKQLDILVANANRFFFGSVLGTAASPPPALENYLACYNLSGILQTSMWQGLFPLMPADGYARILNTISRTDIQREGAGVSPYLAGKQALHGFSDVFRQEVGQITATTPGMPYEQFRIVNINPSFIATTLYKIVPGIPEIGPYLGDFPTTPGIAFLGGGAELLSKSSVGGSPESVACAAVQLLKMQEPFLDVRIEPGFFEPVWENVFCGSPDGLFPAARDCINRTPEFLLFAEITTLQSGFDLPLGTCFINQPEDWDIVPAAPLNLVTAAWPSTETDFEIFFSLNGGAKQGPLVLNPGGLVSNGIPFGNSYEGIVDLTGFSGQTVTLQAFTEAKGGMPIPPNEFGATQSRIVNLVVQ